MILKRKGLNIVISAPSGVGKSTLIKRLLKNDSNLAFSISATTRAKRDKEIEGESYFFKTKNEFYKLIENQELMEYKELYGNFYGTLTHYVKDQLNESKDLIFDLDYHGATSIKQKMPKDTITIFILPPSLKELKQRIEGRNTENKDTILYRLAKAKSELAYCVEYDYIVINDEIELAFNDIKAIIEANRLQKERMTNLEDFINNL